MDPMVARNTELLWSESRAADAKAQPRAASTAPAGRVALIAHIIHRLDYGGLENGLVNLVNTMPSERFRHVIICLTEYTDFRQRIRHPDVECFALHKRPGKDVGVYWRLWRLLRRLRPDIVHTRNLAALDSQLIAAMAGVSARVHGEHGRDVIDIDGRHRKYNALRRGLRPFVRHYIPLSRDLERWLTELIGVPPAKMTRIYNGVDNARFHPVSVRAPLPLENFAARDCIVIGSIGRMEAVKDPLNLVRAFLQLRAQAPDLGERLRLVMIGDGPLLTETRQALAAGGAERYAWLPGARDDVPELLQAMDLFALPSLAEGISNTILEAMASGLPVVATNVGGNAELITHGKTGALVPASDSRALAVALEHYVRDPQRMMQHGRAARARIECDFSLARMTDRYVAVYDALLAERGQ